MYDSCSMKQSTKSTHLDHAVIGGLSVKVKIMALCNMLSQNENNFTGIMLISNRKSHDTISCMNNHKNSNQNTTI